MNSPDPKFEEAQKLLIEKFSEYDKTRYGMITLSLQELVNNDFEFIDLLLFISLLDSQNISLDLLKKVKPDFIVERFIRFLRKHSFITGEKVFEGRKTISIHRSIQEICLIYLIKILDLHNGPERLNSLVQIFKKYLKDIIANENYEEIKFSVPHVKEFIKHTTTINPDLSVLLTQLGEIYYLLRDSKRAINVLEKSLQTHQRIFDENNLDLADLYILVGRVYGHVGKYSEGKTHIQRGHNIILQKYGNKSPKLAFSMEAMGVINRNLGKYDQANRFFQKSLFMYEILFGKNHPKTALILANIGFVERFLGHYKTSEIFLEKSYKIFRETLGSENPKTGWVLMHLGNTYRASGHYKKALSALEKSLKIAKKGLGNKNIETAWISAYLGNVYRKTGDYEKARKLIQEEIIFFNKYYGENHYRTAWGLLFLGKVFRDLKMYEKSEKIFNHVSTIFKKHYGDNHLTEAWVLCSFGKMNFVQGKYQSSQEQFMKALQIYKNNNHHSSQYYCLEFLGDLCVTNLQKEKKRQSKLVLKDKAYDYYNQSTEMLRKNFSEDSPHLKRLQSKLHNLDHLQ